MIRSIELRSDVELANPQEMLRWVTIEVGQSLDPEAVARSLRNLRAAGVAAQVEAYRQGPRDRTVLAFVVRGKTMIEKVSVTGRLGLKPRKLRGAIAVGEGEPLLADRVFRSFHQLQELYEAEGYLNASVRLAIDEDEVRRRASIRFDLDSGPSASIGEVTWEGDLGPFSESELESVLRSRPGAPYRPRLVRDDRERLESWLLRRGYRQVTVQAPVESRIDETRVDIRFTLKLGVKVSVETVGDDQTLRRKELLPLQGEERLDDGTVSESERRIRFYFQQQGHYRVEVAIEDSGGDVERTLRVDVEPGPRYSLRDVRFSGNHSVTSDRLKAVMRSAPKAALSAGTGVLVDEWLQADLTALRALYALEGFHRAEVGPARVVGLEEKLELEIPIIEGDRRRVSTLTLDGIERLDAQGVREVLRLQPGGPYHPRREEEALDQIRSRYEDAGFALAQVTSRREISADENLVAVGIEVLEGPRSLVERVIVRGQKATRGELIRRVLDLPRGTPVSQRRLLEAQRRLYGLGIFSRVDVRVVPGTPYSAGRDLMVEVREGDRQRVNYGFGYDSEDGARGLLGYSHSNLWGRAVSGRVDARASQRDYQLRTLLRQPYLGRFRLPVTYSLFDIEQQQESFRSRRRGGQVEIERPHPQRKLGLLYTYRVVDLEDPDPGLEPLLIDRDFQETTISSVTPSVFLDYRDDVVDPSSGWSATLLTEYAFPALAANEEFLKLFAQHARYLPLHRAGVVAASVRFGAIEPLSGNGEPDPVCMENGLDFAACDIKISERFFAGGRTTHRAYRRDRLGIAGETLLELEGQDDPVPFGGAGLLLANVDYRFPIAGGLGGTVFVDGGNVWPDWRTVDLGDLAWGAGVGLRYSSPIGPVRLEIGWKLDREPGEDPYVVLFSIGNPF